MSSSHVDRNLLFGILALQMDFISRDALIGAMHAWVLQKSKPLGQILVEQRQLATEVQSMLNALVVKHIAQHQGDPQQSLAALRLPPAVQHELEQFADPEVNATLARLPTITPQTLADATTLPCPDRDDSSDGRFDVLRRHAWGGLGEVYVAEDRELHREVALKRLHERHADDKDSRARFLQEAEVTGGLEHPGIVPVYGLGTSGDGRPYYAMRFIRGQTLKEAIKSFHSEQHTESERRIELRQLLTRFVAVCNAVEYAHSRGVIHRDIKPNNIMLGKYGETLVVDWGLAKALRQRGADAPSDEQTLIPSSGSGSSETLPGSAIGTPAYMSPEQSEGRIDEIGPTSDVYSLGATFYTILTGKEPFESSIIGVILGRVQTGDFVPPRECHPAVPRALNAICLKAMSLLPQDRYPSCAALASDIEHWLADEPVTALKDPLPDRLIRFIRRHRVLAATSIALMGAAVFSLVIGTTLLGQANSQIRIAITEAQQQRDDATEQRRLADTQRILAEAQKKRAEENFRQTRQAVDRYFTLVSESRLMDVPGAEPLRKELLSAALEYYQRFPKAESGNAEVQAELAAAYLRMAQIQNATGAGNWLPTFQQGVDIVERLVNSNTPLDRFKSLELGVTDIAGQILSIDSESIESAIKTFERSIEAWKKLVTASPTAIGFRNDLATMYTVLGELRRYRSYNGGTTASQLSSDSLSAFSRGLEIWKSLNSEHPENRHFRAGMLITTATIAQIHLAQKENGAAIKGFQDAVSLAEALVRENPQVLRFRDDLERVHGYITGFYRATENLSEAVQATRRQLTVQERAAADFPSVPGRTQGLQNAYASTLIWLRDALPRLTSSLESFLQIFDLYAEVVGKQNALKPLSQVNEEQAINLVLATGAPSSLSFPSDTSHLELLVLAALKNLYERTPQPKRAELLTKIADRAKNASGYGRKTYWLADVSLRWWSGEREGAVKLLETYAREIPDDAQFHLALVRARASTRMGSSPALNDVVETTGSGEYGRVRGAEAAAGGIRRDVDRLTIEIEASLREKNTLVVWLFDATPSMKERREAIAERFDNIYRQLGNRGVSKRGVLKTAVAKFGRSVDYLTPEPVDDVAAVQKAIRQIKEEGDPDKDSAENVFEACLNAAERFRSFLSTAMEGRGSVMIVLVTDQRGSDVDSVEAAIVKCRNLGTRVYCLGNDAVFGREKHFFPHIFRDGHLGLRYTWRGPETARLEHVQLPFWGQRGYREFTSGFGPYALCRLCAETGGSYSISEELSGPKFDSAVLRNYAPDYRPLREYDEELGRNAAKTALVRAAALSIQAGSEIEWMLRPQMQFRGGNDNALQQQIIKAQKEVAEFEYRLTKLSTLLEGAEKGRSQLNTPRWLATFDLALGRVLALRARMLGYNVMLAEMKIRPRTFQSLQHNTWEIVPAAEDQAPPQIQKLAKRAREYLEGVIRDHGGTQWALLAREELNTAMGWDWRELRIDYPSPASPKAALNGTNREEDRQEEMSHRQKTLISDKIPLRREGNSYFATVVINGTRPEEMIVDTGANSVILPYKVAVECGVKLEESPMTVITSAADGSIVKSKQVLLKSLRVGNFTAARVECIVLPPETKNSHALLGMTFLSRFNFSINGTELELSKIDGAHSASKPEKAPATTNQRGPAANSSGSHVPAR